MGENQSGSCPKTKIEKKFIQGQGHALTAAMAMMRHIDGGRGLKKVCKTNISSTFDDISMFFALRVL